MSIALVNTKELRKTGQLKRVWKDGMRSRQSLMSSARLLAALPSEVTGFCAWGTVRGARSSASVESLGGELEARLKSGGHANAEDRRHAGVVVGIMTELGNELRLDNKPAFDDGAFRAPDGRTVKYRVAAVPTESDGDEHCGWIAVGDWWCETAPAG
ncbi:MAG: hypothetical protein QF449_09290 [Alphaproteobacteria bacterium]|jgi:hypothetical protein|nr:hypothetical protein [Alphaproteobacteria bacterium]MDP6589276.1 hypothetical protein [Alphaproteobacteria bacterium]MDP6818221.1 hypothetical protein [Alphaproteobacteria bacterium]|tara:strand:+ start:107 stop:577 length:471 start_codon:yes stop_codon:yes gene_type:complete